MLGDDYQANELLHLAVDRRFPTMCYRSIGTKTNPLAQIG